MRSNRKGAYSPAKGHMARAVVVARPMLVAKYLPARDYKRAEIFEMKHQLFVHHQADNMTNLAVLFVLTR